jgi:hypothetical protein
VCVTHSDFEIGMTKDSLQCENIATIDQEMTCESMPENVGRALSNECIAQKKNKKSDN